MTFYQNALASIDACIKHITERQKNKPPDDNYGRLQDIKNGLLTARPYIVHGQPAHIEHFTLSDFICPSCGIKDLNVGLFHPPNFCRNCGQALSYDKARLCPELRNDTEGCIN